MNAFVVERVSALVRLNPFFFCLNNKASIFGSLGRHTGRLFFPVSQRNSTHQSISDRLYLQQHTPNSPRRKTNEILPIFSIKKKRKKTEDGGTPRPQRKGSWLPFSCCVCWKSRRNALGIFFTFFPFFFNISFGFLWLLSSAFLYFFIYGPSFCLFLWFGLCLNKGTLSSSHKTLLRRERERGAVHFLEK